MNQRKANKIINALKNGGIPQEYLESLVVGRDAEILEFKHSLQQVSNGICSTKMLLGNYGSGKSCLMNLIKRNSLRRDFVVSYFQIDQVFRMNKLDDFYYYMMHNLLIKDNNKIASFDDIFELWVDNLKNCPDKNHSMAEINRVIREMQEYNDTFARALLSYIRHKIKGNEEMFHAISSWLSGEKNIPYKLKSKFNVIGFVNKRNVFDFLKAFAKLIQLLGYNGLVIMIDEMDLILNERVDIRKKSYENIKSLIDLITSDQLVNTMVIFSATEDLLENKEKGLRINDALMQRLGEAIESYHSEYRDLRQPIIAIEKLSIEEFLEISKKIKNIFEIAYDCNIKTSALSLRNWVMYTYHKNKRTLDSLEVREFITRLITILNRIDQSEESSLYENELSFSYGDNNKPIFKNILKNEVSS